MLRKPPDQFLTPTDLDMIERALKVAQRPTDMPADLEDRATIAVWLFQGEVRDEQILLKMLSKGDFAISDQHIGTTITKTPHIRQER